VNGKRTGWCQQHDEKTFEPRPGRTFELASICPEDTTATIEFLMRLKRPSAEVVQATEAAVEWLKTVKLSGIRVQKITAPTEEFLRHTADFDMVVVRDPQAPPLWARHYEIGTNRPVFAGRDGVRRYAFYEIERERRTGTRWYGTWPQKLIEKEYPRWRLSMASAAKRSTEVSIHGASFFINGQPTYEGRTWHGKRIAGLLLNARLVQGIFDDLNPETVNRWAYPDTGRWDPDRNTREFVVAMPEWRRHGLLGFTINLQGGSPQGYSTNQPWHNSAINPEGTLRPASMARLEKILDRADALGMVAILGLFYFGQDERLRDEAAVVRAVDAAVDWINDRGYRNVLVEINNECNVRYDHAILRPERVHELISRVHERSSRTSSGASRPRLLVGTSYGGGMVPKENVVRAADFLLMHGNGVAKPERIMEMVRQCRRVPGYRPMPILFNEDDHFDFDKPQNNMLAAIAEYASWGYFDPGESNYRDGYQCPPVNWQINTPRKKAFFHVLKEITGQ
jgi:hypothetical protein